jgi:hypothetical protein
VKQCAQKDCYEPAEAGLYCLKHLFTNAKSGGGGMLSSAGVSSNAAYSSTNNGGSNGVVSPRAIGSGTTVGGNGNGNGNDSSTPMTARETAQKLAEELCNTEKSYGQGLRAVCRGMILRLKKLDELKRPVVNELEILQMFLNINDVY